MNIFSQRRTNTAIAGPVGQLELTVDGGDFYSQVIAIICHPNPAAEGSMNNKVVTTLSRAYRELGVVSIRFNFRGVGLSEGDIEPTVSCVNDLVAVVDWVRQQQPNARIILAGFSFGAMIAATAADAIKPVHLSLVAPPTLKYPFPHQFSMPVVVHQGMADELFDARESVSWGHEVGAEVVAYDEGSHFFHGQLPQLKNAVLISVRGSL